MLKEELPLNLSNQVLDKSLKESMEFPFDINQLLPDDITVIDSKLHPFTSHHIKEKWLVYHLLSYSSFISRTCNLWNVLSSSFPKSYNLPSFKSNINRFDLPLLLTYRSLLSFFFGALYRLPRPFLNITHKKTTMNTIDRFKIVPKVS